MAGKVAAAGAHPAMSRLATELDHVLAWLVAGYTAWKAGGLDEPAAVTEATSEYRGESDVLGRFISERCLPL